MPKGKILAFLTSLLACALAKEPLDAEWQSWKSLYERQYGSEEEEELRRERWEETWKKVTEHNKLADQGKKSYRMAMNHFADRTFDELNSMIGLRIPAVMPKSVSKYKGGSSASLPQHVDWRDAKCVTAIKDQGSFCRADWAFSVVGVLESRYCIKTGHLMEMSEQMLLDCDQGDGGCCGGYPPNAFQFISKHGLMASNKYKYKERAGECRLKLSKVVPMNMSKYYDLHGEDTMAVAVAYDGPISTIFGVTEDFFFYNEGIYDDDSCDPMESQAFVIVGYGTEDHEDYWIVKNSWGHYWGENGYARIRRNTNVCNIGGSGSAIDIV